VYDVVVRKFTFAISSPDEFPVICPMLYVIAKGQIILIVECKFEQVGVQISIRIYEPGRR